MHRAHVTLAQIEQPFAQVGDYKNRAIRCRLLFPLLAHYLHLSRGAFFALLYTGCLLARGLVAKIARNHIWLKALPDQQAAL